MKRGWIQSSPSWRNNSSNRYYTRSLNHWSKALVQKIFTLTSCPEIHFMFTSLHYLAINLVNVIHVFLKGPVIFLIDFIKFTQMSSLSSLVFPPTQTLISHSPLCPSQQSRHRLIFKLKLNSLRKQWENTEMWNFNLDRSRKRKEFHKAVRVSGGSTGKQ